MFFLSYHKAPLVEGGRCKGKMVSQICAIYTSMLLKPNISHPLAYNLETHSILSIVFVQSVENGIKSCPTEVMKTFTARSLLSTAPKIA